MANFFAQDTHQTTFSTNLICTKRLVFATVFICCFASFLHQPSCKRAPQVPDCSQLTTTSASFFRVFKSSSHTFMQEILSSFVSIMIDVKFINLPLGVLGTIGSSSESFINLLKCLEVSQPKQQSILSKMINITI